MRSWLTASEVRVMLGSISQPRVSQLVRDGQLVVEKDGQGRYRYDRITTEKLAEKRAMRNAISMTDAAEREATQSEARDRMKREREREERERLARQEKLDDLWERGVKALERLARVADRG